MCYDRIVTQTTEDFSCPFESEGFNIDPQSVDQLFSYSGIYYSRARTTLDRETDTVLGRALSVLAYLISSKKMPTAKKFEERLGYKEKEVTFVFDKLIEKELVEKYPKKIASDEICIYYRLIERVHF